MDRPETDGRPTRAARLLPWLRRCGYVVLFIVAAWAPGKQVHAIDYAVNGGSEIVDGTGHVTNPAASLRYAKPWSYRLEACVGKRPCCCLNDTKEGGPVDDDGQDCDQPNHNDTCCHWTSEGILQPHQSCCNFGAACCHKETDACDLPIEKARFWIDLPLPARNYTICDSTDGNKSSDCPLTGGRLDEDFMLDEPIDGEALWKYRVEIELVDRCCDGGSPPRQPCVTNNDCDEGSCVECGRCRGADRGKRCLDNGDCASPGVCGPGWCQAGTVVGLPCVENADCGAGGSCSGGSCLAGTVEGLACSEDLDCGAGGDCVGFRCCQGGSRNAQVCLTHDDCPGAADACKECGTCQDGTQAGQVCFVDGDCLPDGTCAANRSGRYGLSGTKPPDTGVPALSAWGLVTLTVVMLAAGTLVIKRRRPAAAL